MSDASHVHDDDDFPALSPDEVERFRQILLERRLSVEAEAKSALGPFSDRPPDESDVATNETQSAFDSRLQDRASAHLKKIDKALRRIERQEYDECESCGDLIPARRLQARPEATLCIECKEEQEILERGYVKRRIRNIADAPV